MILPIAALVLAVAPAAIHYDCAIENQYVLTPDHAGWNSKTVEFPDTANSDWRFAVDVTLSEPPTARVTWARDLVQIAGTHDLVRLAPGHYAFAAASAGHCMFTEEACLALVELADRDDSSASVMIAPAGLAKDAATGKRSLLEVTSFGTCRRSTGGR